VCKVLREKIKHLINNRVAVAVRCYSAWKDASEVRLNDRRGRVIRAPSLQPASACTFAEDPSIPFKSIDRERHGLLIEIQEFGHACNGSQVQPFGFV
jgi:hypothetical protein